LQVAVREVEEMVLAAGAILSSVSGGGECEQLLDESQLRGDLEVIRGIVQGGGRRYSKEELCTGVPRGN
jgi:hypothetical protein